MYPKIVIEHFMKPRNVGKIANPSAIGYASTEGGGKAIIYIAVENGIIKDFKYQVDGCPYAIACASILSEEAIGKDLTLLSNLNMEYYSKFFEIPEDKQNCIKMIIDAVEDAFKKLKGT